MRRRYRWRGDTNHSLWLLPILFVLLAAAVAGGRLDGLDERFLLWLQSGQSPQLTRFMVAVTNLGGRWPSLLQAGALGIILWLTEEERGWAPRRPWLKALLPLGLLIAASALGTGGKLLLQRPRPELWSHLTAASGFSFPSGHATRSIVLYGLAAMELAPAGRQRPSAWWRRAFFLLLIFLVGLSRLYLGVHWPSDIIGGFLLGGSLLVWTRKLTWLGTFPHKLQ